ncbi:MAG TPA: hypothetical protein DIS79_07935 [Bacteroidetes bacterium]|nr:hypothetical protein [Bacteroidota bacterium]
MRGTNGIGCSLSVRIVVVTLVFVTCLFFTPRAYGQVYLDSNTSHRFAQLTIGTGIQLLPPANGLSPSQRLTLHVGGIHFWGHTHFFVEFSPVRLFDDAVTARSTPLVETGAEVYPWRIENSTIRPFVGASWLVHTYADPDGPVLTRNSLQISPGATWSTSFGLISAAVNIPLASRTPYPMSDGGTKSVGTHGWYGRIRWSYPIETTLGAESFRASGSEERMYRQLLDQGKLDGLFVSFGASSAIAVSRATFLANRHPEVDVPSPFTVLPIVSLGWRFEQLPGFIQLAYRPIIASNAGYGTAQRWIRHAIGLEGVTEITNYHGFVPFVGIGCGYDFLSYRETRLGINQEHQTTWKPSWHLVGGWDIRPTKIDRFILRTIMRWSPGLSLAVSNGIMPFDHLEIDFIQLSVRL